MKFRYRFTLILALSLLTVPALVFAQTTGTIEGTVTDQSGGALPGVTVEATSPNLQGTRTATTGADGHYRFASLPPGDYKVTGNLSGFSTVRKNATVMLDSTATVNLQMRLATAEAITNGARRALWILPQLKQVSMIRAFTGFTAWTPSEVTSPTTITWTM